MKATIVGEKALIRRLNTLAKDSHRRRIARPAVREAASKINKAAKRNVVEETGLLKKSIGVATRTIRGVPIAIVGARHGYKQEVERTLPNGDRVTVNSDPTKYAHLVEFGTSHSPPMPFLRPAYSSVNSKAIIARRMWHELRKQAQNRSGGKADKTIVSALRRAAR